MNFKHLFNIPGYITKLEQRDTDFQSKLEVLALGLTDYQEKVDSLEQKIIYLEGQMKVLGDYFTSAPQTNEIEDPVIEEVDITEDYRIPIVSGIKVKYENEPDSAARPLNVYPQGASKGYGNNTGGGTRRQPKKAN